MQLEMEGFALGTDMTIREYMKNYLEYKVASKTIESSTIRGYKADTKMMCKYISSEQLSDLNVAMVNSWMARMSEDYAPKVPTSVFAC